MKFLVSGSQTKKHLVLLLIIFILLNKCLFSAQKHSKITLNDSLYFQEQPQKTNIFRQERYKLKNDSGIIFKQNKNIMKFPESHTAVHHIIQTIDEKIWNNVAKINIEKHVPQNIKNMNIHNIQSFVYMNSNPKTDQNVITKNIQNRKTLVEPIANSRVKNLRIKTQTIHETPNGVEKEDLMMNKSMLRKSNIRNSMKSSLVRKQSKRQSLKGPLLNSQFKRVIKEDIVDHEEQARRMKKQRIQQFKREEENQTIQIEIEKNQKFAVAQAKYKNSHGSVTYDYDGDFLHKKSIGQLPNEKVIEIRSQYGQSEISKKSKIIKPTPKTLPNEMIEARDREDESALTEKERKSKILKGGSSVQSFLDSFKDETISQGVKIGQVSTNTWRQNKLINQKKLINLKDFKNSAKNSRFKEFNKIYPETQKMKIKTEEGDFSSRRVETLDVVPSQKIGSLRDKVSQSRKRMKTYFDKQITISDNSSIFSKLSKLNASSTSKAYKNHQVTIGNPILYEEILSLK